MGFVLGRAVCRGWEAVAETDMTPSPSVVSQLQGQNVIEVHLCDRVLSPHLPRCVAGFTLGTGDYRAKEDMYEEIIRLKKV